MDNFQFDQAEGLRRMLAGPRPRIFTFLSATRNDEKSTVLVNLCTSLARAGSNALLLDASMSVRGVAEELAVAPEATLLQVARREKRIEDAVLPMRQGFGLAVLAGTAFRQALDRPNQAKLVAEVFDALAQQADVLLIDAELDADDSLPLPVLEDGEIVVQVSDDGASIKSAYSIIKRLNGRLGRRPFSVLVTGTTEQRARMVYQNIAKVASRYLAVSLNSIGFVPQDEHILRANRLGRAVIDAFPLAGASTAFRQMAERFVRTDSNAAGISVRGSNLLA